MYREFLTGDWQSRGACRGEDPELFFPVGDSGPALLQTEDAKAVCEPCPVAEACLRWALEVGEVHGVWGGTSEDDRRRLRRVATPTAPASTRPGA